MRSDDGWTSKQSRDLTRHTISKSPGAASQSAALIGRPMYVPPSCPTKMGTNNRPASCARVPKCEDPSGLVFTTS